MRKLELFAAAAALAVATPLMAQGRGHNKVPPGQRPPAGMCRIWIDGVPPGRQPAPTRCDVAARRLPPNARIIYGDGTQDYGRYNDGYYGVNDPYYNDRVYQDRIRREREIEIAREQERERAIRAREIEEARERAIRDREIRDRNRDYDRDRDRNRDYNRDRDHDGDRRTSGTYGQQGNVQITRGTDGRPIAVMRNPYHRP
jgi:hypothetical protein